MTQQQNYIKIFNIKHGEKIISYLGSLGTWYMADEMMIFFKLLAGKKPEFRFLFITPDEPELIYKLADKHAVKKEKIIIIKAPRNKIPDLLSLSQISLFFIKPVFSKKGSSPTKQAEILSMGIPILCNDGIGDTTEIIKNNNAGYVIDEFTETKFLEAINKMDELMSIPKTDIRKTALNLFSLNKGGDIYHNIYQQLQERNQ